MNIEEISARNDLVIKRFIEDFAVDHKPIEVSFRTLLPEIKNIDRYTHLIHSYPAKLLVHIPYFFLNNSFFSNQGDTVLDPFNGSGTVLLESILANRNAVGADVNPLARLIAEVKVTKLDTGLLPIVSKKVVALAINNSEPNSTEVINCDYWFPIKVKNELARLFNAISTVEDEPIKKFLMVSFSNCVKKVSYADPRISVPVKINPERYSEGSKENMKIKERLRQLENINVIEKFSEITAENIQRFKEFEKVDTKGNVVKIISNDARKLSTAIDEESLISNNSIQLVITSPPYAGAQKYIRSSSLNLNWTKLASVQELLLLDKKTIGRENYRKSEICITKTGIKDADELIDSIYKINPVRAQIVCNYLLEMKMALKEIIRVLKNDGYLILIVGNNKVCNKEFNTQEYFTSYLLNCGLRLQFKLIDDIRSYGLMTKRNKTADIISREWILVFKKEL